VEGKEATWTIDMKNTGTVYLGPAKSKADVTIILDDDVLVLLGQGEVCATAHHKPLLHKTN
jgi:hypothetical protein